MFYLILDFRLFYCNIRHFATKTDHHAQKILIPCRVPAVRRGQGKGLVRSEGILHQMDEIYMMRDGVLERQE